MRSDTILVPPSPPAREKGESENILINEPLSAKKDNDSADTSSAKVRASPLLIPVPIA